MGCVKLHASLPTVLDCAHGYKEETKTSLLSSQESFGFAISFTARKKGCVKSDEAGSKNKCGQKEG